MVLTVPMRNGNHFLNSVNKRQNKRSYRTYEEWKHVSIMAALASFLSSYRTYEEWKQYIFICSYVHVFGSYRTYEEWKLGLAIYISQGTYQFLPYLWGMETVCILHFLQELIQCSYRTYEEWKRSASFIFCRSWFSVLTVPMRNGNK